MRWIVYAMAALTVLVVVCLPEAKAQDAPVKDGNVARPAPPEVGAPLKEGEPVGSGSAGGIVANDGSMSASFFFAEKPPGVHYTYFYMVDGVRHYFLTHDRLELAGSDKTGNYWHYRSLRSDVPSRPFPRDWYIPKKLGKHPDVWFQTQEPDAKIQFYGRAVEYAQFGSPTKEMIAKLRETQAREKKEDKGEEK